MQETEIHEKAYIAPNTYISGKVKIGADSSIWPMTVIRGDVNTITIGQRTSIQDGSILHVTHDSEYFKGGYELIVEDDVTIGHKVTLHGCHVKSLSLVGIGSILLDGSVVESGVMVAAGSLVPPNKVLESGYLWMGSPVKKIRKLTEKEKDYLKYSAMHYVKLKNTYM